MPGALFGPMPSQAGPTPQVLSGKVVFSLTRTPEFMENAPKSSHSTSPRVSVIVTAHDRQSYLHSALVSLDQQSLPREEFEVVLVSNIEEAYLRPLLPNLPLRMVLEKRLGLGQKIATALPLCRAPIICFLEDDDAYAPEKLSTVLDEFRNDPQLGFYHNHYNLADGDGRQLPASIFRARTDRILRAAGQVRLGGHDRWAFLPRLEGIYPEFSNSCISIRRDMLEEHLDWLAQADLATDQFLLLLALRNPWNITIDARRLTTVRLHGANTSRISRESRNQASGGTRDLSERNYHALSGLAGRLKEGQPPEYSRIVDSVIAVETALLDLRRRADRGQYTRDLRSLMELRTTYPIKTREPLIGLTLLGVVLPSAAQKLYRSLAGQIS